MHPFALRPALARRHRHVRTVCLGSFLLAAAVVATTACGGEKDDGEATCKDVEAAMRRLESERTKNVKPGSFERVCLTKVEEYSAARRGCIIKAKSSSDLKACAEAADAARAVAEVGPTAPASAAALVGTFAADSVKQVKSFGVELDAPADATVEQRDTNVHVSNGRFKLNLFVVDEYSAKTGAAKRATLQKEAGFVKLTTEKDAGATWRFDYELANGKAGTTSRIVVGERALDCGVHAVEPAVAAIVAASCGGVRALGGAKEGERAKSAGRRKTGGTANTRASSIPTGATDTEMIGRVVKANSAKIRVCYEKELLKAPGLTGRVTVSFVIGADGRVVSSRASGMGNAAVESCVASVMQGLRFAAPSKPPLAVKYPFAFRST